MFCSPFFGQIADAVVPSAELWIFSGITLLIILSVILSLIAGTIVLIVILIKRKKKRDRNMTQNADGDPPQT